MLEPCPNFVSRPPRAILPKKTENLPTNLPKKAEILPKVQTCVTQHKLVSLQYKPCLSFLYNQNNKPAHATLIRHLKTNAKPIMHCLKNINKHVPHHAPLLQCRNLCTQLCFNLYYTYIFDFRNFKTLGATSDVTVNPDKKPIFGPHQTISNFFRTIFGVFWAKVG